MAVLAGLHADAIPLSRVIGGACEQACNDLGYYSMLTDALVASSNTNQGLQDNVTAASVHADESYAKARINVGIELGDQSGELSDARILSLTTTDQLVELTYAATSNAGAQPPE